MEVFFGLRSSANSTNRSTSMQSSLHPINISHALSPSISDSINMSTHLFFSLPILVMSLLSIAPLLSEARKNNSSFSFDLIHRDSPLSPFYNSSMTHSERTRKAALRSLARFHQFSLNDENDQSSPESIITPDGGGDYVMRIYIGTPPVEKYAIADTGSNLIWVQCSPCDSCFQQDTPLFDPSKSSTYVPLSCDSKPCTQLPVDQHDCGPSNKCLYSYGYGDNSTTNSELALDSINFGSSSEGQGDTFPKSVFGCGNNNSGIFSKRDTGIVGLGAGELSLVSQLSDEIGHKFSYCLVDEAIITGNNGVVSTPFTIRTSSPEYYYLNLEGISVGQNTVQSGQTSANIIIDSGSTLTSLEPSFYNGFVDLVKKALGAEKPSETYDVCFDYNGDSINYPDIVFHFAGADVSMKPEINIFTVDNDLLCLLVVPTKPKEVPIFGNMAQINFQVEYDLEGKKVSFAPADCTKS